MKFGVGHIISRTIIILMMSFLCLPCSLKREFKQTLNIPVANPGNTVKNNKAALCQNYVKDTTQKVSVSYGQKDLHRHHHNCFSTLYHTDISRHYTVGQTENVVFAPVPIYILQEHYLI